VAVEVRMSIADCKPPPGGVVLADIPLLYTAEAANLLAGGEVRKSR